MSDRIIAYDIGTSGVKTALYEGDGTLIMDTNSYYETSYPRIGWHEQSPADWWDAIVKSTHEVMALSKVAPDSIGSMALSGHYFGVVPVDKNGRLLRERTPIWSDTRAKQQGEKFAKRINIDDWYLKTGSFLPGPYTMVKIMWYMDNEPGMLANTHKILGTKDFINFKLTGRFVTDNSYASGSGVYDLEKNQYSRELIRASGIPEEHLPEIVHSTHIIGSLTVESARELGLHKRVKVACGGGDTSCMALGAKGIKDGRIHTSLGSSAFIAITSAKPILNLDYHPNVFAHVIPGMYNSTMNLHSAGSAFRWVRDILCSDLVAGGMQHGIDPYELMTEMAGKSPVGANKLLFYPALAMAGPLDSSVNAKGAFTGLDLKHSRNDMVRATMEGVGLSLGWCLNELRKSHLLSDPMLLAGGGSTSSLWRQIFADIYNMEIIKTNIGQNAAVLGAASLAAVGTGLWKDFSAIDSLHQIIDIAKPIPENCAKYAELMSVFKFVGECQSLIGDKLSELHS